MKIDLHLHSHVSDGDLSPAALVAAAIAAGLDLVALTDHDTAAGVADAIQAAAGSPLLVIPGIEISTRLPPHELHVLGYWIDPHSPPILAHQEASIRRRTDRMERMIDRLRAMGIGVSFEDVARAAGPEVRSIGRPHLARALLAGGFTRYYGEAFARYISDSGPAFVTQDFPSPAEAIATIHAAGGLAVWAHPPLELVAGLLPDFVAWGLDGLECFRPSLQPDDVERLRELALAHALLPTGGSDWHGPHRSGLGEFFIGPEKVSELLASRPIPPAVDGDALCE